MQRSPIRFFLLSIAVGFAACYSPYKKMQRVPPDNGCIPQFQPSFSRAVYKCSISVIGKELSGLLLIKKMPDSSLRMLFSSETGFSFFDFGFRGDSAFTVYHIIPQMNKKAVVRTLRKDFELILFRNTLPEGSFTLRDSTETYHGFPQSRGINYYVTDTNCVRLFKMQRASARKPVMEAMSMGMPGAAPDSITIRHLNFNFTILLTKIDL